MAGKRAPQALSEYRVTFWRPGVRAKTVTMQAVSESALGNRLAREHPGWTFDVERQRNPIGGTGTCDLCGKTHRAGTALAVAHSATPGASVRALIAQLWGPPESGARDGGIN